jgi:hypothetical protein
MANEKKQQVVISIAMVSENIRCLQEPNQFNPFPFSLMAG